MRRTGDIESGAKNDSHQGNSRSQRGLYIILGTNRLSRIREHMFFKRKQMPEGKSHLLIRKIKFGHNGFAGDKFEFLAGGC